MTKLKCIVSECNAFTQQGICDRHVNERCKYGLPPYINRTFVAEDVYYEMISETSKYFSVGCKHVQKKQGAL